MKFNLTRPCAHCPFRKDIPSYLTRSRVEGLCEALDLGTFDCHETTHKRKINRSHCAGALILNEKVNRPSQMAQIAERLGIYDPSRLDMQAQVFDTWEEMIEAQER